MAKIVTLRDDLNGSTNNVSTRQFGLNGRNYIIDLSDANFARLEKAMARFVEVAEEVQNSVSQPKPSATVIRQWLKANGYDVGDRGKISADMVVTYKRNHRIPLNEVDDHLVGVEDYADTYKTDKRY